VDDAEQAHSPSRLGTGVDQTELAGLERLIDREVKARFR
jgi:hypothetical protein